MSKDRADQSVGTISPPPPKKKCEDLVTVSGITLDKDQLKVQIFNTFITILYTCMFRAISCSSSGGQIVLTLKSLN